MYFKSIIFGIIFIIIFFFIVFLINRITNNNATEKYLRLSFKGVIIESYSPRKKIQPTFLKVDNGIEIVLLPVSDEVIKFSDSGDSIVKNEAENLLTIRKRSGKIKTFIFLESYRFN